MDFPVKNDSARPSNIYKQEIVEEENEEIHLDIKSEDQNIDMDNIKIEYSATGFNLVNIFVDESETLETLEEQSIMSNDDPLSTETTVPKRKEKSEREIIEFFILHGIRSTKPRKHVSILEQCARNCFLKLTKDDMKRNFDAYWHKATFSSRYKFIYEMTEIIPTKYRFSKLKDPKYRQYQSIFYLNTKNGRGTFCRICFRRIIGEQDSLIDAILDVKLEEINKETCELPLPLWSPLSSCQDECYLKLTEYDQRQNLFSYRKAKTYEEKFNFIKDKITMTPGEKSDPAAAGKPKNVYFTTFALNSKTGLRTVCPKCFRTVLNESENIIRSVLHSMLFTSLNKSTVDKSAAYKPDVDKSAVVPFSTDILDNRSILKLPNPTWEETMQVESHIRRFPMCEGHHYPGQSSETYLPMGLALKTLYKLYKSAVYKPVSFSLYQFIFQRTDFKFQPPFLGKCEECELAVRNFRFAHPEQRIELQNLLDNHIAEVEGANDSKLRDEIVADSSNDALMVCYFGYQQSLPTPCLREPLAYYKRPLWTYNFIIQRHSNEVIPTGNTKFYMWDESQGKKTANEMASCLYGYLKTLSRYVRSVIFCSSSACQESRSKTVSMMFSYFMVSTQKLQTIEHKFLPEGHFQLEGQNLYNGENYRGKIEEPKDWYEAFRNPVKAGEMVQVIPMTAQRFYNFENLWKDPSQEGEPLIDKEVKRLLYTKNGVVCYTDNWSASDRFAVYRFEGQSKFPILKNVKLENVVNVSIAETKKQDLLGLLPLLKSSKAKSFYFDLCRKKNPDKETVIVKEEVDLNGENREVEAEENSEPPQKISKKICCETDFDQFPLDIKEETIE